MLHDSDSQAFATLVAVRDDLPNAARVSIGDTPLDTLRALSEARHLRCPYCGGLLLLKAGAVRAHHFAHVSLTDCAARDHEPESESHRAGKLCLYTYFRPDTRYAALEQPIPATDQRADAYVETTNGLKYALEFQQANNSAIRWRERHALYAQAGVIDLWFLGQLRFKETLSEALHPISPYDPLPVPRDIYEAAAGAFRVREMEKAMLETPAAQIATFPALYYLDPESELLTILLLRDLHANTLRAYRYRLPLSLCTLQNARLSTPLDALLTRP